jgi:hypothetical protein
VDYSLWPRLEFYSMGLQVTPYLIEEGCTKVMLSLMLFILTMDVLGFLISKAKTESLLKPLASRALRYRVSFYVDDVVLFLHPAAAADISLIMDILQVFGEASGFHNNVHKSSFFPIRCTDNEKMVVQQFLPYEQLEFPCRYLGLPLSLKLTREQLQPIIDKIADQLPSWKADLLTKPGRKIMVQFVITGMMIYLAMALDLPAWAQKAIDKFHQDFFWRE